MAESNGTVLRNPDTVGMDMVPPYAVYLNGEVVATHDSERAAGELFNKLTGRPATPTAPQ